jgi:hypothetical protein
MEVLSPTVCGISMAIMMPWIKNGNDHAFRAVEFAAPHCTHLRDKSPLTIAVPTPARRFRESPLAAIVPANQKNTSRKSSPKAVTPGPALQEETL